MLFGAVILALLELYNINEKTLLMSGKVIVRLPHQNLKIRRVKQFAKVAPKFYS